MNTLRIMSTMPGPALENNIKIVEGALDKLIEDAVEYKSRGNQPRQYRKKRMNKMGTTTTAPTETKVEAKNYELGVPTYTKPNTSIIPLVTPDTVKDGEKSKFTFKIRGNGDYSVSKKIFDLEKMEKLVKYNTYNVSAIKDFSDIEAMDKDRAIALMNLGLQKESLVTAKQAIGGGNTKGVTDFINNFRNLPQFVSMVDPKLEGEAKTIARAAQAKAILEFVKKIDVLWAQLELLLKSEDVDEDEDSESSNSSDKD